MHEFHSRGGRKAIPGQRLCIKYFRVKSHEQEIQFLLSQACSHYASVWHKYNHAGFLGQVLLKKPPFQGVRHVLQFARAQEMQWYCPLSLTAVTHNIKKPGGGLCYKLCRPVDQFRVVVVWKMILGSRYALRSSPASLLHLRILLTARCRTSGSLSQT